MHSKITLKSITEIRVL